MHRKTLFGLLGILGIWFSAGLALPFVNVLTQFTPEQLMFVRALIAATLSAAVLKGKIGKPNRHIIISGLGFAFGCMGYFHAIREIGASLTAVIMVATPLTNFFMIWRRGKKVSKAAIISLVVMLAGVAVALKIWGGTVHLTKAGIAWNLFAFFAAGLYYEAMSKIPDEYNRFRRAFWQMTTVALVAIAGMLFSRPDILRADLHTALLILGFGVIGGFVYVLSNIEAFQNLSIENASVLAQGETPVVILASRFILGEHLEQIQWMGVAVALLGACGLSFWMARQAKSESQPPG